VEGRFRWGALTWLDAFKRVEGEELRGRPRARTLNALNGEPLELSAHLLQRSVPANQQKQQSMKQRLVPQQEGGPGKHLGHT